MVRFYESRTRNRNKWTVEQRRGRTICGNKGGGRDQVTRGGCWKGENVRTNERTNEWTTKKNKRKEKKGKENERKEEETKKGGVIFSSQLKDNGTCVVD